MNYFPVDHAPGKSHHGSRQYNSIKTSWSKNLVYSRGANCDNLSGILLKKKCNQFIYYCSLTEGRQCKNLMLPLKKCRDRYL